MLGGGCSDNFLSSSILKTVVGELLFSSFIKGLFSSDRMTCSFGSLFSPPLTKLSSFELLTLSNRDADFSLILLSCLLTGCFTIFLIN